MKSSLQTTSENISATAMRANQQNFVFVEPPQTPLIFEIPATGTQEFVFYWDFRGQTLQQNSASITFCLTQPDTKVHAYFAIFTDAEQKFQLKLLQKHTASNTYSSVLVKTITADASLVEVQDTINVAAGTTNCQAYFKNPNLVLSETARIHSQPILEIFANDVQSSHGSTISGIDETQLFYLQSRGIPIDTAKGLLAAGFSADIATKLQEFSESKSDAKEKVLD